MLQPGDRIDQFEVRRVLGQGAYATSYLARNVLTGEEVVLKCPSPASLSDPEDAVRFRREALIARRLHHANIQSAVRAPIDRDSPYLVLEYLDGRSLRTRLQEPEGPTIDDAAAIARQIAAGLQYAHEHGVYHRDLKPENVIVQPDGTAKLIDFGSARLAGFRRLTWRVRGETVGTPDYMAPEQIEGGRGDARTDLYALGVMLYEMLTAKVPFSGDNANAVMFQHVNALPIAPRSLRPDLPPEFDAIVMRLLAKRPDDRYQSARALLRDLQTLSAEGAGPVRAAAGPDHRWRFRIARRFRQRSQE